MQFRTQFYCIAILTAWRERPVCVIRPTTKRLSITGSPIAVNAHRSGVTDLYMNIMIISVIDEGSAI